MQHQYIKIINDIGSAGWCYRNVEWDVYALSVLIKKRLVLKRNTLGESNDYYLSLNGKRLYDALLAVVSLVYYDTD